MKTTFTNVFYEKSLNCAKKRLEFLRKTDKYPEIKAYIQLDKPGSWRVLRKVKINLTKSKGGN